MTRFQAGPVWAAYEAQRDLLRAWLADRTADEGARPSVLERWTVLQLTVHLANVGVGAAAVLEGGASIDRPVSLAEYTSAWPAAAGAIAALAVDAAEGLTLADALQVWDDGNAALAGAVEGLANDLVVRGPRGALRVGDFLATRVNELVVHAGDLTRSVPEVAPVPVDRKALAVSCRMLTTILGERHPGHSVEVRVPPFAAVQAIEGPRHTRGTPANVVETDPATWVLVAAGRLPYADAVASGLIQASGLRADLGPYLPLFHPLR